MKLKSVLAMLVMLAASSLKADLTGITTTPINFPAFADEMAIGGDGNVWILTDKGNIGKVVPGGGYTEYPIPWGTQSFGGVNIPYAQYLTAGIDGNVWVVGSNGHVARVTPAGTLTDFTIAASGKIYSGPIVSGADGALWFYAQIAPAPGAPAGPAWKMVRIDIYGQVTTYDLGISGDNLRGLVSGGDSNLWFVDTDKSQVVKFSITANSVAGTFAIPSPSNQNGDDQMALGPDGNVWFTRGTSIDRVTPAGTITEFHIPSGGQPAAIVHGGDGNLWFTEPTSGKLGEIVVSSISGSSASFNETGAILNNAYELFVLPGHVFKSGKAGTLEVNCGDPCSGTTYMVRLSPETPTTGNVASAFAPPPTTCADVHVNSLFINVRENLTGFVNVEIFNLGPQNANSVLTSISVSGAELGTVEPNGATATVTGDTVVLTGDLPCKSHYSAFIEFTAPTGLTVSATAIAASCCVPDPDPTNNVSASVKVLGGSLSPLPPPDITPIITPVQRGGH